MADSLRERIGRIIGGISTEESKEEKVMLSKAVSTSSKKADIWSKLEERITKTVPLGKIERLYHTDYLTFRAVNKYIDSMIGPGSFLEGDKEIVRELDEWRKRVKSKHIKREIVRDVCLAGNAWVELGYNEDGDDIPELRMINPKLMDFIRDSLSNNVSIDKDTNEFVGYRRARYLHFPEVMWKKDGIYIDGKSVWSASDNEDGRDRIAHFKLWGLGESYLGMSVLEPVYLEAIIRLNISKSIGESAFRQSGLIGYIGAPDQPATNEEVDQLAEDLKKIKTETVFVFKDRVKLDKFPSTETEGRARLLYYYADAFATGVGIPLTLLMEPPNRGYKGDITEKGIAFEQTIKSLQEILAEQEKVQFYMRYMKARGLDLDKIPNIVYKIEMPIVRRERAREIATLARRDLIKRDPELEKHLREELNLPISLLDKEIETWKAPSSSVKEIKEKLEDVIEEIIERKEEESE